MKIDSYTIDFSGIFGGMQQKLNHKNIGIKASYCISIIPAPAPIKTGAYK